MVQQIQPLAIEIPPSGEHFLFRDSFRSEGKRFRFTWTLAPGKTGPGEHVHEQETESFRVLEGVLTIWIDGKRGDYGPGMEVAVPPGVRHRFKNFGKIPAVAEVSLDGPRMEDMFIPLASLARNAGAKPVLPMRLIGQLMVQIREHRSSTPVSAGERAFMAGLARLAGLFGVKPLPIVTGWDRA